ncbi:hypothetical protein CRUP_036391 [Coryphaenoides rupestris]|nr:hypothetical protein CRUP_036391 [Coryphaenoides rupestris]
MCQNRQCIPKHYVCDHDTDCSDGSDESMECHPGFRLKDDGKTCVDIDECTTSYPCTQRCINTHGSFHCLCVDGFQLSPEDPTICKSTSDEKPFLIFANRYYLRKINLDRSNYTLIKQGLNNAVALDFHYQEQMIYWTDVTTQGSMIRRMHINGSDVQVLHRTSLSNPDGLAVDWVAGNLYWCDKGRDTIEVSKLNGAYRTVLVNTGLREPRAVAVDVRYGYLYWSDWGENPHIGRVGMDGTNRSVIDIPHIFAMTLFEEYIYWTDWETKSINRAHKTLGTNKTMMISTLHRPMDVHIYHPYRQPQVANHPCQTDNGGCSNLCLLSPGGGYKCACPTNFYLAADGRHLMFWTNWNELSPSIMRATLSGANVLVIIGSDIRTPNGLAIDHRAEKLYFSDATLDKIERCEYDGSRRHVVLKNEPVHPFGLAVYGDYIFWTDWVRRAVLRADKYTGGDMKVLRADIPQQPMGIVAVANDTNSCKWTKARGWSSPDMVTTVWRLAAPHRLWSTVWRVMVEVV